VAAPGATSETSLSDSGAATIELRGSKGTGKYGEPRVKHILYECLGRDHKFSRRGGAKDQEGEDDLICIDGQTYVLQIVTALTDDRIPFDQASTGTVSISTSLDEVARGIEKTIRLKVGSTNPPHTILALDANLLGVMADESLVDAYHRAVGSPASFGFAAIWIVGPTVERCLRLDKRGPGVA
jgi:hypothetical protein